MRGAAALPRCREQRCRLSGEPRRGQDACSGRACSCTCTFHQFLPSAPATQRESQREAPREAPGPLQTHLSLQPRSCSPPSARPHPPAAAGAERSSSTALYMMLCCTADPARHPPAAALQRFSTPGCTRPAQSSLPEN